MTYRNVCYNYCCIFFKTYFSKEFYVELFLFFSRDFNCVNCKSLLYICIIHNKWQVSMCPLLCCSYMSVWLKLLCNSHQKFFMALSKAMQIVYVSHWFAYERKHIEELKVSDIANLFYLLRALISMLDQATNNTRYI